MKNYSGLKKVNASHASLIVVELRTVTSRVAMMTTDSERKPTLSGGPLKGEYIFSQLHFHWGDSDDHGSEDEFDGKSYAMELHIVFFKKDYLDSTAALDHEDGLCVLACLFEVNFSNHFI